MGCAPDAAAGTGEHALRTNAPLSHEPSCQRQRLTLSSSSPRATKLQDRDRELPRPCKFVRFGPPDAENTGRRHEVGSNTEGTELLSGPNPTLSHDVDPQDTATRPSSRPSAPRARAVLAPAGLALRPARGPVARCHWPSSCRSRSPTLEPQPLLKACARDQVVVPEVSRQQRKGLL